MSQLVRTALYALLPHPLDCTRDDSHLSCRFVAYYLNGYWLVYDIEQLVGGFTNFGEVIRLTL